MFTNSYPKGGGGYKYYNGKKYTYVVFWTRVQNTSLKPLALHIQFPTDSIAYFKTTESHIRILLPTAPMSPEKIQLYDYGLNNLQSIVSNKNLQQKMLQKTIDAKEDFFFYVSVLFSEVNGSARASFVLKGQDLFYKFSAGADSTIIPCGRIVFKH
jgi:hypothetical protein